MTDRVPAPLSSPVDLYTSWTFSACLELSFRVVRWFDTDSVHAPTNACHTGGFRCAAEVMKRPRTAPDTPPIGCQDLIMDYCRHCFDYASNQIYIYNIISLSRFLRKAGRGFLSQFDCVLPDVVPWKIFWAPTRAPPFCPPKSIFPIYCELNSVRLKWLPRSKYGSQGHAA